MRRFGGQLFGGAGLLLAVAFVVGWCTGDPDPAPVRRASVASPSTRAPAPAAAAAPSATLSTSAPALVPATTAAVRTAVTATTAPATTAPTRDCSAYWADADPYNWEVCLTGAAQPYVSAERAHAILAAVVPGVTLGSVADVCSSPQPCAHVYLDGLGGGEIGIDPEPGGYPLRLLLHEAAHHLTPGGGHGYRFRCTALALYLEHGAGGLLDAIPEGWCP